jgi:acetyl-CoA carboxylase beta subunit
MNEVNQDDINKKCPKCSEIIHHLDKTVRYEHVYKYFGDGKEKLVDSYDSDLNPVYDCPECHETLFTDDFDANTFLELSKS